MPALVWSYCTFHKHVNSKVQKLPSQLHFLLPSIIITITSNDPWNTETHKTDRNPPITNHKPWPFEPVKVKFCFLRGLLRWLTAAKNAIVSWPLNYRLRMFVKSTVRWGPVSPVLTSPLDLPMYWLWKLTFSVIDVWATLLRQSKLMDSSIITHCYIPRLSIN